MPGIVVILLLVAFFAGIALVWVGLRGRKLNNHPVCTWCRFDLEGVYPEVVTCPECGAGLKREKAIRIGVRKRLPALVLMGAVFAAIPVAPIAAIGYALLTGTNVDSYKPLGVLLWEAKHSDATRLDALAGEIETRMMANKLDPAQYQRVIESTLAMQKDTSRTWTEAWGDLIERAKLDGALKPEQEKRFASQAAVLEIQTRPTVHAGEVMPVRIKLKEARIGSSTAIECAVRVKNVSIDGQTAAWDIAEQGVDPFFGSSFFKDGSAATFSLNGSKASGPRVVFMGGGGGLGSPSGELVVQVPENVATGIRPLELELTSSASGQSQGLQGITIVNGQIKRIGGDSSTADTPMTIASTVRVVDPTEPLARAIPADEGTEKKLAEALRPDSLTIGSSLVQSLFLTERGMQDTARSGAASVQFDTDGLPAPIACDVYCRAGGREWKLGELHSGTRDREGGNGFTSVFRSMASITINGKTVTRSSSSDGTEREVEGTWKGEDEDRVDIILRPSADVAAGTLDLESYYGGEIVLKDVPVVRDGSAMVDPFQGMRQFRRELERAVRPQRPSVPKNRPRKEPGEQPL